MTAVFTGYVILLFAMPATLIVESLGTLGAPATILCELALLWYLWHHLHRDAEHPAAGASPVRRAGLALILVMLLVYGHAMTTFIPGDEITNADSSMLRIIGLLGLMLVACDGINTVDRWQVLMRRLAIAGACLGVLAIAQFFTNQLLIDHISIPGLTNSSTATDTVATRGAFTRPSATATNAIEFGSVLAMLLPIAFTNAQTARRHKVWAWVPVVLMGFSALISLSRTAIICVALGMAVLVPAWNRREKIALAILAPFAVLGAGAAVPGLLGTLKGLFLGAGSDSSVSSRTQSYGVAWSFIQRHLFLGRGYGTFLPRYWILDNAWLQLLIGAGVVGVITLLVLIGSACTSALRAQRIFQASAAAHGGDRRNALLARSLLASVVAGAVSLFFFDGLSFVQCAGCFMILLGMAGASLRLARVSTSSTDTESFID